MPKLFLPLLAATLSLSAQPPAAPTYNYRQHYTKFEYAIPMRDGAKLHTAVFVPKDDSQTYPFLLLRTPYSVRPYGVDHYPERLGPSEAFARDGFIFVYQDVRGRFLSQGDFVETRPHRPAKQANTEIDESTDTYDTIAWLLQNVPRNNGRAGIWGISYPGFYAAAALPGAHPALKAASPQAPIGDLYMGDDAYHNGAFLLAHNFGFYTAFVERKGDPARPPSTRVPFEYNTPDGYDFYLRTGPLAHFNEKHLKLQNPYWNATLEHPNYDEFWQSRSIVRHMKNVTPAVLTVGGWFDAEDLAGPLTLFRAIEKGGPKANHLVMGPWTHGGWSRDGRRVGNLDFAAPTGDYYREHILLPFFAFHLKDRKAPQLAKAHTFVTGLNEWRRHTEWPPAAAQKRTLYLAPSGKLAFSRPPTQAHDEYVSDPAKPVPHVGYTAQGMRGDYMSEDQRFAAARPDVLVYETDPLDQDFTIAGPIHVDLHVSTSGTDSDFIVKLIDVYPGDYPDPPAPTTPDRTPPPANAVKMGGYQQLVRGEPFRGRFRRSFEKPEPFVPNQPDVIRFDLPDVHHSFRRGHRIMVQVQSTWFPHIDRNPQTFVEIPKAKASDFKKATQRVYTGGDRASALTVLVE